MDISEATEEPFPSHGQHQNSLEETATSLTSSAETTEERATHNKNEADPRRRRPCRTQVVDALELLRSDTHKEDTKCNAIAARPKIGTRFSPGDLWGGDMKERHDNASKKGNSAHGRRPGHDDNSMPLLWSPAVMVVGRTTVMAE
uniref:Uncharacterized protein n=1 Tax=Oryza rufipogon TaxID=4529 RepID=A0A0E0R8N2_ORYRU